jgi:hypothetical protein
MLIRPAVDATGVLSRALTVAALICCTLVGLSFALFAVDQASHASNQQVSALATGTTPSATSPAPTRHGQPRRFIDDAARTLTSPFRSLIGSSSQWSLEGISTLLALLVYGAGLGYLARYARMT